MHQSLSSLGLLLAILGIGCGGGGGGGVVNDGGGSGLLAATFVADQASPGALSVALAPGSHSGDLATAEVTVTGTDGVFGADFRLTYDPAMLDYVGYSAGTLLEAGGHQVLYAVNPAQPGEIVVGVARAGGSGLDVTSTRPLVRFTFRTIQEGSSALTFQSGPKLWDDNLAEIPALSWFGGTFVAN